MTGMITLAGALLDQFGHPWQRPHRRGVAVRLRPLDQRHGKLRLLGRAQFPFRSSRPLAAERRGAAFLPALAPLVRRLPAHLQQPGHLTRAFAFGEELRRVQPPLFHHSVIALFGHAKQRAYVSLLCDT